MMSVWSVIWLFLGWMGEGILEVMSLPHYDSENTCVCACVCEHRLIFYLPPPPPHYCDLVSVWDVALPSHINWVHTDQITKTGIGYTDTTRGTYMNTYAISTHLDLRIAHLPRWPYLLLCIRCCHGNRFQRKFPLSLCLYCAIHHRNYNSLWRRRLSKPPSLTHSGRR